MKDVLALQPMCESLIQKIQELAGYKSTAMSAGLAHPPPDASADERIAGLNLHQDMCLMKMASHFREAICFRKLLG